MIELPPALTNSWSTHGYYGYGTVTKARMLRFLAGDTSSPGIDIAGDTAVRDLLLSVLEKGDPDFNIVTP